MAGSGKWLAAVLLAAAVGCQQAAFAQEQITFFGNPAPGQWLLGLKGMSVQNGRTGYGDASGAGFVVGYEFARPIGIDGSSSIELEYGDSWDDGSIDGDSVFGAPGDWNSESFGLYFAYRTPGTVYFMGKMGGLKSDVRSNVPGFSVKESDTSFSYGGGLGLRLGRQNSFNVELEFVGSSGDNDVNMINLGGVLRF
jgi:hypothetical protein